MKPSRQLLIVLLAFAACLTIHSQEIQISGSRKAVRKSGDVLAFATPAAGLATLLVLQDWEGLKQGAFAGATTLGMTYALKYIVKKE